MLSTDSSSDCAGRWLLSSILRFRFLVTLASNPANCRSVLDAEVSPFSELRSRFLIVCEALVIVRFFRILAKALAKVGSLLARYRACLETPSFLAILGIDVLPSSRWLRTSSLRNFLCVEESALMSLTRDCDSN